MNWETIAWCEWNEFCQQVLKYHYPNATGHSNIKETNFSIYRGLCDIVTGGFPCQPYSAAGKRLGKEDDRHLWPEMRRAVREIHPRWVVGENVLGITNWNGGMVFDEVQADLEAEGYEVLPFLLPAAGVGAPNKRYRVFFIAHANGDGYGRQAGLGRNTGEAGADTGQENQRQWLWHGLTGDGTQGIIAHANDTGLEGGTIQRSIGGIWQNGNQQPAGLFSSAWENFPTESPLRGGDDGVSTGLSGITISEHRKESLKAYGNAIVPQVSVEIFKAIEKYNLQEI